MKLLIIAAAIGLTGVQADEPGRILRPALEKIEPPWAGIVVAEHQVMGIGEVGGKGSQDGETSEKKSKKEKKKKKKKKKKNDD